MWNPIETAPKDGRYFIVSGYLPEDKKYPETSPYHKIPISAMARYVELLDQFHVIGVTINPITVTGVTKALGLYTKWTEIPNE
jgi:hypothetical protein